MPFYIEGLAGKHLLKGQIKISGAKNAALKAMAAAILFDGEVTLKNIPDTSDIRAMADILTKLGAKVNHNLQQGEIQIDTKGIQNTVIDQELGSSMRASVVLTGPMLARYGSVTLPRPGGCVIGERPIDRFLKGYKKMGAIVHEDGFFEIKTERLLGAEIEFEKISVGATETLMMAAVLADGISVLKNCALEPEIVNVADWLKECGADIRGVGTPIIEIHGRNGQLLTPKSAYVAIPDRIEAGSYLLLGALCAKQLKLVDCRPDHMESVIEFLRRYGFEIWTEEHSLTMDERHLGSLEIGHLKISEYPGFPTDLQAPAVTFLTQMSSTTTVKETIFEGRFKYVQDLVSLGANIETLNEFEIKIHGGLPLSTGGKETVLNAHDIRAGFAIVMAALTAEGKSKIENVRLIDRGYSNLVQNLKNIGAKIER